MSFKAFELILKPHEDGLLACSGGVCGWVTFTCSRSFGSMLYPVSAACQGQFLCLNNGLQLRKWDAVKEDYHEKMLRWVSSLIIHQISNIYLLLKSTHLKIKPSQVCSVSVWRSFFLFFLMLHRGRVPPEADRRLHKKKKQLDIQFEKLNPVVCIPHEEYLRVSYVSRQVRATRRTGR